MATDTALSNLLRDRPRIRLGHLPTPIDYLARASAEFGVKLWMKRDDCTGLGAGGNKVRKLEFLLAEAKRLECDVILTVGSEQSNHARLTAAAAARLGYDCELILTQPDASPGPDYSSNGNILLSRLFGAQAHVLPRGEESAPALDRRATKLRASGRSPFCIPLGGSNTIGSLGYLDAVDELIAQADELNLAFDHVVLASGSGGTQAGILIGASLTEQSWKIWGISVGRKSEEQRNRIAGLVDSCRESFSIKGTEPIEVSVHDGARGPGYGQPSAETTDAVNALARLEGILLDPVYTGKAMAGMKQLIRSGDIASGSKVLFWHTGGAPALFGYRNSLGIEWRT